MTWIREIYFLFIFFLPQSGTHFFCLYFLRSIYLYAETFTKHFQKYGAITDSVIMKDKHTKMPRGFGFVTFSDPSVIDRVLEDEHVIDGRTVRHLCSTSKSRELNFGLCSHLCFIFIKVEVKRTVPKEEMSTKDGPKTKKIFVGGIPPSLTEGC